MFGAFRPSLVSLGGYLWKTPWRMSAHQKYRHRKRLQAVDQVIATIDEGLTKAGYQCKSIERAKVEIPKESEMLPIDKYTVYGKHLKGYRKGIHKVPKWTRLTMRVNPKGY